MFLLQRIRTSRLSLSTIALLSLFSTVAAEDDGRALNGERSSIVFIPSDDQRYDFPGFHPNAQEFSEMLNLDSIWGITASPRASMGSTTNGTLSKRRFEFHSWRTRLVLLTLGNDGSTWFKTSMWHQR